VAFTINTVLADPGAVCELTGVDNAVADGDTSLTINMSEPNNTLLYTLAVLGIVPEASYDDSYGANPIGSGRYLLEQWDEGQQVIFTVNPDYYGEAPSMERVVVAFMDEDPNLAAARAGEIDVAYVYAPKADQTIEGYQLVSYASVDSRGISLPTNPAGGTFNDGEKDYAAGHDVTSNLAIRQALNYAIDREGMVTNVLKGYGTPAYSVADGMPWASEGVIVEQDVQLAKQILADDGWVAQDDGILVRDGVRAEFNLLYPSTDSTRQALAAEFANQAKEIGIAVTPVGLSWDEIYEQSYAEPILWGWGSNSPSELYNLLYSEGWGNFPLFESETVDQHLTIAITTNDLEEANREYQAAQAGAEGIGPEGAATWVWLANVDHLYFVRDGLQIADQKPHPHGHGWSVANNVDQWTWK
ncbi:MAG: ABC transporter substrate-binding protein, partial [Actinomycetaceae bacterium]|nr:ABC transporter substrate-binding protein [Actinomycetaceae bacterium]